MAFKSGRRILGQFPIRNAANTAGPPEPLISKPTSRSAVSGVGNQKCFVAVSGDPGLGSEDLHCFDTMQQSPTGGPELNFIN